MSEIATGFFTQDQIDYVNNVKDEDLRPHLLHQVRLRDNLSKDRDTFEKAANQWPSVAKAVERLKVELSKDKGEGSYYDTWQANIMVTFYNQYIEKKERIHSDKDMYALFEIAAKRFLDLLIS